jgi:hypothetical protein
MVFEVRHEKLTRLLSYDRKKIKPTDIVFWNWGPKSHEIHSGYGLYDRVDI